MLRTILVLMLTASVHAADWPAFRGPTGQGLTPEKELPLTWGKEQNLLWQAQLPGQGHASPIVFGDSVVVCTVSWPGEEQLAKVMPVHHVTCYSLKDGSRRWDTAVPPGPWLRDDFRSGPGGGYAAPTPATDGKLIFCAFGSAVLAALDFDGKIIWRNDLRPTTFDVTVGSSPVLFGDTVLFLCAMARPADSCLIAFAKATGKEKWRAAFPTMSFGHSTPLLIDVGGRPQLLILASGMGTARDALRAVDPGDGRVLWTCRAAGDAASPAFGAGIVYCDSGRGGLGVAVDPGGSGDVSASRVKWTINNVPEAIASPIIVGEYVYRLHRPGILKCWHATDGRQVYSQRLEGLSSDWASPVADGNGRLYFATAGKSYVVQAGPDFKVLATNDLGDPNHASPAVVDGRLILVGRRSVYCVGRKP